MSEYFDPRFKRACRLVERTGKPHFMLRSNGKFTVFTNFEESEKGGGRSEKEISTIWSLQHEKNK